MTIHRMINFKLDFYYQQRRRQIQSYNNVVYYMKYVLRIIHNYFHSAFIIFFVDISIVQKSFSFLICFSKFIRSTKQPGFHCLIKLTGNKVRNLKSMDNHNELHNTTTLLINLEYHYTSLH